MHSEYKTLTGYTKVKWSEIAQVKSLKSLSRVQLFGTPWDCSLPGSSVHGIFQARVLEWVAMSFSRGSSRPRDWTWVSCTAGRRFTISATREGPTGYLPMAKVSSERGFPFPCLYSGLLMSKSSKFYRGSIYQSFPCIVLFVSTWRNPYLPPRSQRNTGFFILKSYCFTFHTLT